MGADILGERNHTRTHASTHAHTQTKLYFLLGFCWILSASSRDGNLGISILRRSASGRTAWFFLEYPWTDRRHHAFSDWLFGWVLGFSSLVFFYILL